MTVLFETSWKIHVLVMCIPCPVQTVDMVVSVHSLARSGLSGGCKSVFILQLFMTTCAQPQIKLSVDLCEKSSPKASFLHI